MDRTCMSATGSLLPVQVAEDRNSKPGRPPVTRRDRLRRFLNAYWLRPENALWMTLRSEVLSSCPLANPSADLCCGDGVFMFLHQGGVFDPAFDVFTAVRDVNAARHQGLDMFDCIDDRYEPVLFSPAEDTIDVGADMKPALLAKAKRLGLYANLIEHDGNRPLPFEPESFDTVYCNAAYWIKNIDVFLSEVARIVRPGGRVIGQFWVIGFWTSSAGAVSSAGRRWPAGRCGNPASRRPVLSSSTRRRSSPRRTPTSGTSGFDRLRRCWCAWPPPSRRKRGLPSSATGLICSANCLSRYAIQS